MPVAFLQHLGPVAPREYTARELRDILHSCETLLASGAPEDALDDWLDKQETALTWRALDVELVDAEWYARAMLIECLRGLRGERAPDLRPDVW
jgi:hypothetical protein